MHWARKVLSLTKPKGKIYNHATSTKISHLLYEKTYSKSRDEMNDFIYNTWFYLQNSCILGMGEKPRNEKISCLVALLSPFYDMEGDCFPVSKLRRKQTGPTLSGRVSWSNGEKSRVGRGEDFILMRFQYLQKKSAGVRVGYKTRDGEDLGG